MPAIHFNIEPKVSIVVCTYNRAPLLSTCIDSVLQQTFQDWELIIVDDGSSDPTFDVVNSYSERHQNIRYLRHQNRGAGLSRNAGIQASFGDYITFLDSDDAYLPTHLESRIDYMLTHPEVDMIGGGFNISEDFTVVDFFNPGQTISIKECILGGTFFGKRHVFFSLKGFKDIVHGEDTDLWKRAQEAFKVHKITQPETYLYTRAEESITKTHLSETKR